MVSRVMGAVTVDGQEVYPGQYPTTMARNRQARVAVLGNSVVNSGGASILSSGNTTKWAPSTARSVNDTVIPTYQPDRLGQ